MSDERNEFCIDKANMTQLCVCVYTVYNKEQTSITAHSSLKLYFHRIADNVGGSAPQLTQLIYLSIDDDYY